MTTEQEDMLRLLEYTAGEVVAGRVEALALVFCRTGFPPITGHYAMPNTVPLLIGGIEMSKADMVDHVRKEMRAFVQARATQATSSQPLTPASVGPSDPDVSAGG